jgi:hypothetical protein
MLVDGEKSGPRGLLSRKRRRGATSVKIQLYANFTNGKKGTVHFANAHLLPGAILAE